MRRLGATLGDLPPALRWAAIGVAGVVVAALVGGGVWAWLQHREAAASRTFVGVAATYRQAMAGADDAAVVRASETLRQYLKDFPRSSSAPQAWYFLGNADYRRGAFDGAIEAFGEAARRDVGSVGALSRLGQGYAWEAKADPTRALETYREALAGRDPKDFLYGELLLAVARAQESLKQPAAAIETYRRYLKDIPGSGRAEEIRGRLALLGAPSV